MRGERDELVENVRSLVDEYRSSCLWFMERDYYPGTDPQILRALEQIALHGDRRAFQEAARIRKWLSRISSEPSAA
jgi:hypothetical protein